MEKLFLFLMAGLATGSLYAISATGLVVTYVTSGVFNLAHGAIGMFLTWIYYNLRVELGWPTVPALAFTLLICAPLIGVVLDNFIFRRLSGASVTSRLVVTLGLLLLLQGTVIAVSGQEVRNVPALFPGKQVDVGIVLTWDQLTMMFVAAATAVLLRLLFKTTQIGVAMRAVVDDREVAALMGINRRLVTSFGWSLGAMLAGAAGILIAPGLSLDVYTLTLLVVTAFAAAVVGRLQSIPITFVGGLGLGVIESLLIGYLPQQNEFIRGLRPSVPFLLLFAALLVRRDVRLPQKVKAVSHRPPPSVRTTLAVVVAATLLAVPLSATLSDFDRFVGSMAAVSACIMLSIVLLTGLGGQTSLAQMSFAGIAAVIVGRVGDGAPWPLALLLGAAVAAAVGALIALPAIRLEGVYLALSTLAFALMADNIIFGNSKVMTDGSSTRVPRPSLLGIDFTSERSLFVLVVAVAGLFAVAVLAIRGSVFGRQLVAMKDSPAASAMCGLNIVRTKVVIFGMAAAMAGVAGVLFGGLQTRVGNFDFAYLRSLFFLQVAAVWGITSVMGGLLAGLFYSLLFFWLPNQLNDPELVQGLQGLSIGVLVIALARRPEGLVIQVRDRITAAWRRWHVPSEGGAASPGSAFGPETDRSTIAIVDAGAPVR